MVDGIPHICHFFTQAKFLENKIYTKKRINYDKLHSKLPILRINYDKLHSKLPIFCVKSLKIKNLAMTLFFEASSHIFVGFSKRTSLENITNE